METRQTNLRLRIDIVNKSNDAVDNGKFPGIKDLSGLVEYALVNILKSVGEA